MELEEMDFLDNPRGKKKRSGAGRSTRKATKRRPPKGFSSWKAYMASIRPNSGGTVAKKKKTGKRKGGHKGRPGGTRRYHRNPTGLSARGLMAFGMEAGVEALGVTAGKVVARQAPTLLKLELTGPEAIGLQVLAGGIAGVAVDRFIKRGMGVHILAGALAAALEPSLVKAKIPFVSDALSPANPTGMSGYLQPGQRFAGYLPPAPNRVANIPGMRSFSDYQEVEH